MDRAVGVRVPVERTGLPHMLPTVRAAAMVQWARGITFARHTRMDVAQLQAFCRTFPDAAATPYGPPDNWLVYDVRGRKFAYFKTSEPERWRFSVRVSPDRFVELTEVPGVRPARWRGRYGWVTIVDVAAFPADYLRTLVQASYERARRGPGR